MLKPLAPRQYSISSSALAQSATAGPTKDAGPFTASISYDVYKAPALSGHGRTFQGVASTFLSDRAIGARIHCYVRSTNIGFHLPPEPKTPVIMIAAGSGIAPMRGFIQERAAIAKARGQDALGPALFYYGCRDFEKDYMYADELGEWERQGAVEMRPAFSRRGPGPESYKYVPDRLWAEREELRQLYRGGAKVYLCGSAGKLAKSVNETLKKMYLEDHEGRSEEEAEKWLEGIKSDRYVTDVFG